MAVAKAEAKAKMKASTAHKQAASKQAAATRATKAFNTKAAASIKNLLDSVSRVMASEFVPGLGNNVRDPVMSAFSVLTKMDAEVRNNGAREEPQPLSFDAAELKACAGAGTTAASLANSIIKALTSAAKKLQPAPTKEAESS
jgi:hypothetical protein